MLGNSIAEQFTQAAKLAKIDRYPTNFVGKGHFTQDRARKGNDLAYNIAKDWS